MQRYDLVVLGAGPGGYAAAIRAAKNGLTVALVERGTKLGGTCLNVGCIPSKALLESSRLYSAASQYGEFGVQASSVGFDLAAMMARKERIVEQLTGGIAGLMKRNKVDVVYGEGRLLSADTLLVRGEDGERELSGKAILLAMGSVPVELPDFPFDGENVLSSTDALSLERVPESMAVIGGGAIGLELGSVWSRLGARVTVVELLPTIAPFAEKQLSKALERSLKAQGMAFMLGRKVSGCEKDDDELKLSLTDTKDKQSTLNAQKLLVAVGRKAASEGQGLREAGVEIDRRGKVRIGERWETSVEGVYAIGDLVEGPMLAHKAEEEGLAVADIIAGKKPHVNPAAIPSVVYTHPELAQVGMTEEQAKGQGIETKSGKFYFKANGRALSMGESEGLVKVVARAEDGLILGVHILGPSASELIGEAALAIDRGLTAAELGSVCHAHPSLSEALKEAAMAVEGGAVHV